METLIFKDDTFSINYLSSVGYMLINKVTALTTTEHNCEIIKLINDGDLKNVYKSISSAVYDYDFYEHKNVFTYQLKSRYVAKRIIKLAHMKLMSLYSEDIAEIFYLTLHFLEGIMYILEYSHKKVDMNEYRNKHSLKKFQSNARDELISQGIFDDYPAFIPNNDVPCDGEDKENKD